jgi:Zn-dependent peptidase ImmA (M78 family)
VNSLALPKTSNPKLVADSLRKSFCLEPGFSIVALARALGCEVYHEPFVDAAGFAVIPHGRSPFIIVNANHPRSRRRFTTAHELGHIVLGHRGLYAFHRSGVLERASNRFAVSLLMSAREIIDYDLVLGVVHYAKRIAQSAARFGVSRQAMLLRYEELGIR